MSKHVSAPEPGLWDAIWDGRGDADGKVYFTKDNGEIVGIGYVRARIQRHLRSFSHLFSAEARVAALSATAGNPEWLSSRKLQTVSSLCREAVSALSLQKFGVMPD